MLYKRNGNSFEKVELYLLKGVLFIVFLYELYKFLKFVFTQ